MGVASFLSTAGSMVLNYALPVRCPGCGAISTAQDQFCHQCWPKLDFIAEPCCLRCGSPFELRDDDGVGRECAACMVSPPPWSGARAALAYGDMARSVVMRLKYGRKPGMARLMARYMAPHLAHFAGRAEMRDRPIVLVPVPLHRWRLWSRGFNQSALIAGHLARAGGYEMNPLLLVRKKATRPLRAMSASARRREVAGAFFVNGKESLKGKAVILIDDVHTSGATASACASALLKAGAGTVYLLCWARVMMDRGD